MPPRSLLLLALTPLAQALASSCGPADTGYSCQWIDAQWRCQGRIVPSLLVPQPLPLDPLAPVEGQAPTIRSLDADRVLLEGGVDIRRGPQSLSAQSVEYDRSASTVKATGQVRLEDARTLIYSSAASADLGKRQARLEQTHYALKDGRGNGTAQTADLEDQTSVLQTVSFTNCPAEDPAWQIKAQRITLDHDAQTGRAEQVRVQLGQVPILYLPFLTFPLNDDRKSGVLSPTIGFGSDGLDLTVPYYFNLAPHYDATLYPRWITERGPMLGGEFRYLVRGGGGAMSATWLPDDKLADRSRDSFKMQHYSNVFGRFALSANLNYVSDNRYFEDLGDSLSASATTVLPRTLALTGRGRGWTTGISIEDYDVIDPTNPDAADPYRRLPRVFFNGQHGMGGLQLKLASELVYFDRESFCLDPLAAAMGGDCRRFQPVNGWRADFTPGLAMPIERSGWFLRPEVALRHTTYQLTDVRDAAPGSAPVFASPRQHNLSRTTPIYSLDAGLVFERSSAFGRSDWRQTLEPRVYYLKVPYRDQDEFPLFDTAALDFSFPQLFRTNRFAGADRQSDANQLTLAVSSSIWDQDGARERARLSLGTIHYFDSPRVRIDGFSDSAPQINQSVWVAEADLELNDNWSLQANGQYDPEDDITRLAAVRVQRRFGGRGVFNVGYRYRPDRLEQVDVSTFAPVSERLSLIGRWNFSLRDDRTLEGLAGFEYRACCYTVRLVGRHHLRAATLEARNGLYFEIELGGLGSVGRETTELLSRAIVGFRPQQNPF